MPKPYSKNALNIQTKEHLSHRLGFSVQELERIADRAEHLYTFDKEPKKNGGFRDISKPHYSLKRIQSAIHHLLREIKVSESAHGGIKGRSNLTNARIHCNQRLLLNLDLKNFFPNISHYRVFELFHKKLRCAPKVASLLTRLSTVKGQVPQGGPMSTDIANLVLRRTDRRFRKLAKQFNINYTRFVDDISFSGKDITGKFTKIAKKIIAQSGFVLNPEKERWMGPSENKTVTGLAVNRKRPNLTRKLRRQIRKEAYVFHKFDFDRLAEEKRESKNRHICGKLAYLNYVNRERTKLAS